jgi:hypothetical protein
MTTFPTVHLNGTSREALLEGYIDCVNAVRHAIEVCQKNGPNARDYYVITGSDGTVDAVSAAMTEHEARLEKLEAVLAELREIGEHVAGLD